MLFNLTENQKPKSYKQILGKLNNSDLQDLVRKWISSLKYPISFNSLEKQIKVILESVKINGLEKTKSKIVDATVNRYGTFIFHQKKLKKINWDSKIKKLKKNKIKI